MSNQSLWDDEWIKSQMEKFHSQLAVPSRYMWELSGTSTSAINTSTSEVSYKCLLTETANKFKEEQIEEKEKGELKFFDPKELDLDEFDS